MTMPGFPEIEGRIFQPAPESEDKVLQTEEAKKIIQRKVIDALHDIKHSIEIGLIVKERELAIFSSGKFHPQIAASREVFLTALKETMEEIGALEEPPVFNGGEVEGRGFAIEFRLYRSHKMPVEFESTTIIDTETNEIIEIKWSTRSTEYLCWLKEKDWPKL